MGNLAMAARRDAKSSSVKTAMRRLRKFRCERGPEGHFALANIAARSCLGEVAEHRAHPEWPRLCLNIAAAQAADEALAIAAGMAYIWLSSDQVADVPRAHIEECFEVLRDSAAIVVEIATSLSPDTDMASVVSLARYWPDDRGPADPDEYLELLREAATVLERYHDRLRAIYKESLVEQYRHQLRNAERLGICRTEDIPAHAEALVEEITRGPSRRVKLPEKPRRGKPMHQRLLELIAEFERSGSMPTRSHIHDMIMPDKTLGYVDVCVNRTSKQLRKAFPGSRVLGFDGSGRLEWRDN